MDHPIPQLLPFLHAEATRETDIPLDYYEGHYASYKERLDYDRNPRPFVKPFFDEYLPVIDDPLPNPWED